MKDTSSPDSSSPDSRRRQRRILLALVLGIAGGCRSAGRQCDDSASSGFCVSGSTASSAFPDSWGLNAGSASAAGSASNAGDLRASVTAVGYVSKRDRHARTGGERIDRVLDPNPAVTVDATTTLGDQASRRAVDFADGAVIAFEATEVQVADTRPTSSGIADLLVNNLFDDGLSPEVGEFDFVDGRPLSGGSSDLTLASLESLAVGSHPSLTSARSRIDSRRGQYVQAGLAMNPTLQYQSEEVGNEDSSGLHTVRVSQEFVTANKLGIARQVELREIEKRRAELRIAELRVRTRVRAAFAAALVAQRRDEIASQIARVAEESTASVRSLYEAEEVSRIALLQANVEAEQSRITSDNASTQLLARRRALAAAVGQPELAPGRLVGEIGDGLTQAPWEALIAEISSTSPELARAGSELERARWSLQLACARVHPNVTGTVGVGVDTATDDTFAVIGLSVPLPIRNRNQGNIRSARADIAAATAAIHATQLELESRLAQAVGRYQVARERYRRLGKSVVPTSEESYRLSRQAFEAGEINFLQLLTAQRTLFTTRLSVLDAAGEAKQAAAEIDGLLVTLGQ